MSRYVADSNSSGSTKQKPGNLPSNAYDSASTPTAYTFKKTPNYVYVTADLGGGVGFYLGSSASFSSAATTEDTTNQLLLSGSGYTPFAGLKAGNTINLHPIAMSGSAADCGKVVFVYKSGLSTGGF